MVKTAACNQTKENIKEFSERCKKFDLAKAEVLNIINMRPSSAVGVYPVNSRKISLSVSFFFCFPPSFNISNVSSERTSLCLSAYALCFVFIYSSHICSKLCVLNLGSRKWEPYLK